MAKNKCRTPEIQKYSNEVRTSYDSLYNQIQFDPHKALQTVQNMELKVNTAIVSLKYIDAVLTLIIKEKSDKAAQWTERKLERSGLF
jgi:putative membrane protein